MFQMIEFPDVPLLDVEYAVPGEGVYLQVVCRGEYVLDRGRAEAHGVEVHVVYYLNRNEG